MAPTAKSGTLVTNTPVSVPITNAYPDGIYVVNRSQTGQIWVRLDGTDPTVAGDDCFVVLGARYFPNPWSAAAENVTVKLISNAALDYTVESSAEWVRT